MTDQKPRIEHICVCGHTEHIHNRMSLSRPVSITPDGKNVWGYKLYCTRCRKQCGLDTRVLKP